MDWQFYIDDLLIDQPGGMGDFTVVFSRDDVSHGVFFEATVDNLRFHGQAANYLQDKKKTKGVKAEVIFKALYRCDEYSDYEEAIVGKLNFGKYKETCGTSCWVTMPIEQDSCTMMLKNRFDQKVDVDSGKGFDGFTTLAGYDKLGYEMDLPAKELLVSVEGQVDIEDFVENEIINQGPGTTIVRPTYNIQRYNSIQTGQLVPVNNFQSSQGIVWTQPLTPQLLYEDNPACFNGIFSYTFRLKGSFSLWSTGVVTLSSVKIKVVKWDGVGTIFANATVVHTTDLGYASTISTPPYVRNFDTVFSGSTTFVEGTGFYAFIEFNATSIPSNFTIGVRFGPDTQVTIQGNKACEPTAAKVYGLNEVLSRVTEAITNNCLKVKSDYYGRTDSEPYFSDSDGCGSLRVVTNGLHVRKAENAKYFISLQDLFDGLNPIDNIGFGIEDDPSRPGWQVLRIEDVSYFYRSDQEILSLPFVKTATLETVEKEHYSKIKVGYEKWEIENVNGLDEFNSTREYRTSLNTTSNEKNILSKFIAGGYPLEIARQQSFAETGGADTKYDNETFIICIKKAGYMYGGFEVEQGNITTPANIYSPDTAYNWRIRPYYNLMRWFKSLANVYVNLSDTDNKLFFTAGTGNYLAEGEMHSETCKLENGVKAENRNLSKLDFATTEDYTPIWKPETEKLNYPLSLKQYKEIKSKPYGYVSFQCGNGEYRKGFIKTIFYKPTQGTAEFLLKPRWP